MIIDNFGLPYSPKSFRSYSSEVGILTGAIAPGSVGLYVTIRTLSEPPMPEYYRELIDQIAYYPWLAIIGVLGTLSFAAMGAVAGLAAGTVVGVIGEELYGVGKGLYSIGRRIQKKV